MICFNPKSMVSSNWHLLLSLKYDFLMTPFDLFFSVLSEIPEKFYIGSTEFKLYLSTAINFSTVDPM